jgi:hypothetical protein
MGNKILGSDMHRHEYLAACFRLNLVANGSI